jgi:6-pyruvoyltetrahydropterin/6-carboxytetrahydropterin synthase
VTQSIKVRHNVEMAHRLSLVEGKCRQIHGHSWWVELEIVGPVDEFGILREFGEVKQAFRHYLDETFDHKLLLNRDDPIVEPPVTKRFPGVRLTPGDPTTENVARWIGHWAQWHFGGQYCYNVVVWETAVNCATWTGGVLDATSL